jgi:hypothetical protein
VFFVIDDMQTSKRAKKIGGIGRLRNHIHKFGQPHICGPWTGGWPEKTIRSGSGVHWEGSQTYRSDG